ncbi:MAG: outer membrane protein assembly factor BamA [Porticoccus sp.]|nr:outer membrane protein assembly factor BamA [Porticoccus sp.]MBQ0806952.1 outer membrane protein assembly factor BamA [Porticoccus sp.]
MKHFYLLLCLILLSTVVRAEVFQVEDIRIDGLQRVSSGTVFASMPLSVGDLIDGDTVRRTTRALFRTGYFDDIRISRDGGVLIVTVKERPAIAEIIIQGNSALPTEELLKSLRENGLAEGQIFRQAVLDGISQELERQYVGQGRYGAAIESDVEELPRNRVAVNINVDEGDVAAIKHINLVGVHDFDEETLVANLELKTTGLLSPFMNDDKYSQEKLSGDLERLESYYLDRGYLKFSIDSTQVAISPDREDVFVTINVTEGDVYTVDQVELSGDLVVSEDEIRSLLVLKEGQTFSQIRMVQTTEWITARLGDEGYTFAEVKGVPEVDEENKTAKVTLFIDPGRRAYVRRIEFRGNTKTMDEVLRREMRQMEGASASTSKMDLSKVRLQRTGYFKEVQAQTQQVPGTNDQVDVFYTVEEQPSGSIGASLGFAQTYGIVFGASIQENNFLGTGKSVGISLNRSGFITNLSLNYSDPYYTRDGINAGFSLFARETDFEEGNISSYSTDAYGTRVNFSYPLDEVQSIGFGLGYENLTLKEGSYASQEISEFIDENGDVFDLFTSHFSWGKSTVNRGQMATRGASQQVGLELSFPTSDMEYYKLTYAGQYFHPLTDSLTMRLRTDLGYGDSYGDTTRLPFFKNYYAGGFGSVRGFEKNTLGPRDTPAPGADPDPDPFGGNVLVEGSAEVIFPLPFIKDQRSIQMSVFMDFGNVFDTDCRDKDEDRCQEPSAGDLRYSVGIGGTWNSTFGPLTFSLAKPLNAGEFDEEEVFQFSMGQTF